MADEEKILKFAASIVFILFFGAGTVWFVVDTLKTIIRWKAKDEP